MIQLSKGPLENLIIRKATPEDTGLILHFITELAIYEKEPDAVEATEDSIRDSIFGDDSTAQAIICLLNNKAIGFAVYFYNYSTWLGKKGLYLEDLYIMPEHRNCGAGKEILKFLAKHAIDNNCGRFEWSVLDWNEPAIKFYESIGARPQSEWVIYRLTGEKLREFADR